MDVTPLIKQGQQIIESYGDGAFTVSGKVYTHAIVLTPEETKPWDISSFEDCTQEAVQALLDASAETEILLIGCGEQFYPVPPEWRATARAKGVALELMDTGAACRTYNILLTEGRHVLAALIAV